MLTQTEENYLKAIYKIYERTKKPVHTNAIANDLNTTAASVTDMMKKLFSKDLIEYERYKGSRLTSLGSRLATSLIRRHRLWETFLVEKLNFSWEEVHDIAEELEHIHSEELIDRLDRFLDYPRYDPHGDPIPNADGKFTLRDQITLPRLEIGQEGIVVGVIHHDTPFLQYLNELKIGIGSRLKLFRKNEYDGSLVVNIDDQPRRHISEQVSKGLLVKKTS